MTSAIDGEAAQSCRRRSLRPTESNLLMPMSFSIIALQVLVGLMRPDTSSAAGFEGIPGDYCRFRRGTTCCPNRDDDCTVPILDTLCYCDMFCDRSDGGDCCPDFLATCRGVTTPRPRPRPGCNYNNVAFKVGDQIKQNCNKCTCEESFDSKETKWACESNVCIIEPEMLAAIRDGPYSWKPTNYSEFWGQSLDDGLIYRLGTLYPERSVQNMNEILVRVEPNLPERFDVREKWPRYIHRVRNQGNCGSSWAFSTTSLSADRYAIQSEGRVNPVLSPQQLLSCNQHRQKGCEGGYLDRAWYYIRKLGVVSEDCYPYTSGHTNDSGQCRIRRSPLQSESAGGIRCPSGIAQNQTHKVTPPYRVSAKESEIMTEILTNGPVQATFLVNEDFYMYKSGVYQHSQLAALKGPKHAKSGFHSVRILGWGVDRSQTSGQPIKYWLCDNSWGESWGENGLFRIIRGVNHCRIESFVIGVWGKGNKRRRRKFRIRRVRKFRKRF